MNKEIKGIDGISVFSWNTEKKEFYVLGQKFDGVNSIEDFINYITKLQQIEKEHQNCTRKHWQQKCFEHSANEKIYKLRIKKIRNYVNSTDFIYDEQYKKKDKIENILNGSDENE